MICSAARSAPSKSKPINATSPRSCHASADRGFSESASRSAPTASSTLCFSIKKRASIIRPRQSNRSISRASVSVLMIASHAAASAARTRARTVIASATRTISDAVIVFPSTSSRTASAAAVAASSCRPRPSKHCARKDDAGAPGKSVRTCIAASNLPCFISASAPKSAGTPSGNFALVKTALGTPASIAARARRAGSARSSVVHCP